MPFPRKIAGTNPILDLSMPYRVMYAIALQESVQTQTPYECSMIPGPPAAANASSPIKKSRSSVPLFADKAPPEPAPPVRNDGLLATAGRPDPELPDPPGPPFVAIAVGKTNEGESLPANPYRRQEPRVMSDKFDVGINLPSFEKPVPLL